MSTPTLAGIPMDEIRKSQTSYQDPDAPLASGWNITPFRFFVGITLMFAVAVCVYIPLRSALE